MDARELAVRLLDHRAEGQGNITVAVSRQEPDTLRVNTEFSSFSATHIDGSQPLFQGSGLTLAVTGPTALLPGHQGDRPGNQAHIEKTVSLRIPQVRVANLNTWQRYLPPKWAVALHGGNGLLQAEATLTPETFSAQLHISSSAADLAFRNYRVTTNLDLQLNADAPSLADTRLDISGSYLRISETRLKTANDRQSRPLTASVDIDTGAITLQPSPTSLAIVPPDGLSAGSTVGLQPADMEGLRGLLASLKRSDAKDLIGSIDADFNIKGQISRLDWINLFIGNSLKLVVSGYA